MSVDASLYGTIMNGGKGMCGIQTGRGGISACRAWRATRRAGPG